MNLKPETRSAELPKEWLEADGLGGFASGIGTAAWIYFTAPVLGMLLADQAYRGVRNSSIALPLPRSKVGA